MCTLTPVKTTKRRDWRSGLMGIWIDHKKAVVVSESIVAVESETS